MSSIVKTVFASTPLCCDSLCYQGLWLCWLRYLSLSHFVFLTSLSCPWSASTITVYRIRGVEVRNGHGLNDYGIPNTRYRTALHRTALWLLWYSPRFVWMWSCYLDSDAMRDLRLGCSTYRHRVRTGISCTCALSTPLITAITILIILFLSHCAPSLLLLCRWRRWLFWQRWRRKLGRKRKVRRNKML